MAEGDTAANHRMRLGPASCSWWPCSPPPHSLPPPAGWDLHALNGDVIPYGRDYDWAGMPKAVPEPPPLALAPTQPEGRCLCRRRRRAFRAVCRPPILGFVHSLDINCKDSGPQCIHQPPTLRNRTLAPIDPTPAPLFWAWGINNTILSGTLWNGSGYPIA